MCDIIKFCFFQNTWKYMTNYDLIFSKPILASVTTVATSLFPLTIAICIYSEKWDNLTTFDVHGIEQLNNLILCHYYSTQFNSIKVHCRFIFNRCSVFVQWRWHILISFQLTLFSQIFVDDQFSMPKVIEHWSKICWISVNKVGSAAILKSISIKREYYQI